ncbi:hypothetical protein EVAR_56876_1 [Eumeta japonica]|uniref:Uncharacterized protein n=1 Tax=Eumeta variegata TaxID=151549 RepID=A0A4C1Z826_EUMVA|nr:hypothetical protein EVAR_56876_1 [Eumeta japonica]
MLLMHRVQGFVRGANCLFWGVSVIYSRVQGALSLQLHLDCGFAVHFNARLASIREVTRHPQIRYTLVPRRKVFEWRVLPATTHTDTGRDTLLYGRINRLSD